MNGKAVGIGGALVLLACTLIGRFEGLITDQALIWAGLVVGMGIASWAFSIGATEYYKRRTFSQLQIECINSPHSMGCDKEKRRTYNFAVRSGFAGMALNGIIFILLEGATWRHALVIAVFWLHACAIVGVISPLMWRIFRNRFLTDPNIEESEALNRPSEVPRD